MGFPGLRVLHLLDSLDIGGTERNAVRLLRELKGLGADVRLGVFRDGPLRADLESAGIPLLRLPLGSLYSPRMLSMARRVAKIVRDDRIQLLHAHDRYSNVFAAVASRLGASVPLIVSKRWDSRRDSWPMRLAARFAFGSAARVLANSEAVAETLTDERVAASKICVIPNFVDDALFGIAPGALRTETRAELGIRPDQLVIVCVANLRPVKNHALLLAAFAALRHSVPDVLLLLVGDGTSRPALEHYVGELGLTGQVRFLGQRSDGWRLHAAGDLSVLASVSEGFPNALVEAQALEVPVVATAVGGVVEAVAHRETGLLVPEGDLTAFAEALRRLLGDATTRRAMGTAGRQAVRQRYSRSVVLAQVQALYRQVIQGGAFAPSPAEETAPQRQG
jgi:glycosyltransferase involved in cell wall biosynthesis